MYSSPCSDWTTLCSRILSTADIPAGKSCNISKTERCSLENEPLQLLLLHHQMLREMLQHPWILKVHPQPRPQQKVHPQPPLHDSLEDMRRLFFGAGNVAGYKIQRGADVHLDGTILGKIGTPFCSLKHCSLSNMRTKSACIQKFDFNHFIRITHLMDKAPCRHL